VSTNYKERIVSDLSGGNDVDQNAAAIALSVLDFFSEHDPENHNLLSASSFQKKIPRASLYPNALLRALSYLCVERVPLLEMKFKYYSEKESRYIDVGPDELEYGFETSILIDSSSGEEIGDFQENVAVFYSPTGLAKDIYERHSRPH